MHLHTTTNNHITYNVTHIAIHVVHCTSSPLRCWAITIVVWWRVELCGSCGAGTCLGSVAGVEYPLVSARVLFCSTGYAETGKKSVLSSVSDVPHPVALARMWLTCLWIILPSVSSIMYDYGPLKCRIFIYFLYWNSWKTVSPTSKLFSSLPHPWGVCLFWMLWLRSRSRWDRGRLPKRSLAGDTPVVDWGVRRYRKRNREILVSRESFELFFKASLTILTALSAWPFDARVVRMCLIPSNLMNLHWWNK